MLKSYRAMMRLSSMISDTFSTAAGRWRCCLHCWPMVTNAAQADDYQQFAFSKWQRIFKDPMNAAVAIDRLVHHSKIVELNIMQVAKKNKRKKPDGPAKGSKSVGFG